MHPLTGTALFYEALHWILLGHAEGPYPFDD